jgi:predicted N-acetyltransferase YhbS
MIELVAFTVSPAKQRRGIGSLLLKEFLNVVDGDHAGSCITSSVIGRPVYERFGWKVRGEFHIDLSEFGRKEDYVSYNMKRDGIP